MKSALVISDHDNVATALQALAPGAAPRSGRTSTLIVEEPDPPRTQDRARGDCGRRTVIKYGSPIGLATADIAAGTHVHTHNVASSRGRGDLDVQTGRPAARLAEPPDDPPMRAADEDDAVRTSAASNPMSTRPGFNGFLRPDGRVGTRNHVLVVPTVICASVVAERVAAPTTLIGMS